MTLSIPDVSGMDTLRAALAYAGCGWYVGPIKRTDMKNPGSVLKTGWPAKTSRDPEVIAAWFAGTDHGVFLHLGRSGALAADVDQPENLHPIIVQAVFDTDPPWQNTRPENPARRHYVWQQPPGRHIGNGLGRLKSGWGEMRGNNGIIVVAPSTHEDHANGARYAWGRIGDVPVLPAEMADALGDSLGTEAAVTDEVVAAFLSDHVGNSRPGLLDIHLQAFANDVGQGESRHHTMTGHLSGAMKEAKAGYVPAQLAADTLEGAFLNAVAKDGFGKQKGSRTGIQARSEWQGLLSWAVAQAIAEDVEATKARVNEKVPDAAAAFADLVVSPPALSVVTNDPAETPTAPPSEDDATEAALQAAHMLALEVEREKFKMRARDVAREQLAAEKAGQKVLPPLARLDDFLAIPDEEQQYRVAGLWPTGGRVVLSAQQKAGKTTLTGNLLRCLADGQDFLERFAVGVAGRVLLLDNELDERMLRRWLRDQGVTNAGRVHLIPLRGRTSTFDILDPTVRAKWAEHLGPADVLLFDCLRPALDALGLSEDKDAGRFLEALDELSHEAGIAETLVVHHMGHNGERSRGDSRILDWPDAVWKLVRDAEDDEGTAQPRRYFSAYGRDVDQPESLLSFEPITRHLSVAGGSRKQRKVDVAVQVVFDLIAERPGLTGRQIEETLRDSGTGRDAIRSALKTAIEDGDVLTIDGPRRSLLHHPNPASVRVRGSARECAAAQSSECASAPIEGARSLTHSEPVREPDEPAHSNLFAFGKQQRRQSYFPNQRHQHQPTRCSAGYDLATQHPGLCQCEEGASA